MDAELKESIPRAMFRFRRVMSFLHTDDNLHTNEMAVLHKLACDAAEVKTTELHHGLFITKPAVSQILGGLERKGYIRREIDRNDRRRIKITLTPDGHAAVAVVRQRADERMLQICTRFGEDNMRQLIGLLDRFSETMEQLRCENPPDGEQ